MYCTHCGSELPDCANYCLECGKSVQPARRKAPRFEHCEIVWSRKRGLFGAKVQYWAKAIGPNGTYCAARSGWDDGEYPDGKWHSIYVNSLIDTLVKNDWEPIGSGASWYNHKFRREVVEHAAVELEAGQEWEYCKIGIIVTKKPGLLSAGRIRYVAKHFDEPQDKIAVSSAELVGAPDGSHGVPNHGKHEAAVRELEEILISQGWEKVPRPNKEHLLIGRRFRKIVDSDNAS